MFKSSIPLELRCGYSLRATVQMFCLTSFCVAWHGVTSVNWCGIGRTPGREWLQSGLDFGTAEIQYLLYIRYVDEESSASFSDDC